jgi:hypothetical protein
MRAFLLRHGFPDSPENMLVLTDDTTSSQDQWPTQQNILLGLQWLVQGASPGDCLFFHFSGHGAQQPDYAGVERDGLNDTILPLDYEYAGHISDDMIWDTIVHPLPNGCRLTVVMDCCYSGMGLDVPFEWNPQVGWNEVTNPSHAEGDVQVFSGLEEGTPGRDTYERFNTGGAITTAFINAIESQPFSMYPEMVNGMQGNLRSRGFTQRMRMTTSQRFPLHGKSFSFDTGFVPNANAKVGKLQRTHFHTANPNFEGTVLEKMLGKYGIIPLLVGLTDGPIADAY